MTSTRDAADLTATLVDWVSDLLPDAKVRAVAGPEQSNDVIPEGETRVAVRLVGLEAQQSPRSGDTISQELRLDYEFAVACSDAIAVHQAITDLAFALVERRAPGERSDHVRGDGNSITATFTLQRQRDLPRAKPVRERVFGLYPNVQVGGVVRAQDGTPIPRARVQIQDSDRLIITNDVGAFGFAAPDGSVIRAKVSAKGKTTDVELKPDKSNLITLTMEA
jgi:hypothetical protein